MVFISLLVIYSIGLEPDLGHMQFGIRQVI